MSLNTRVIAALNAGVDDDTFERCAVALMANHYPNVVAIEGGSDGGRDADIYAPIADDPDSRGRILVTTGDSLDNLKSSHITWQGFWESGQTFRVDQLVMVTSNPLSDTKRRNILKYCSDHSLPVPTFYTRDWLVESLRKDPEWRTELTGVRGRLEALVTQPSEPSEQSRLVGRGDDIDALRSALALATDICLIGVPGVGKSRLLAELAESAHFIEPLAREYLTDDLVATDPEVVVLDDAHLHLTLLEELVRIRSREQLRFRVLAVSWPGSESEVEALLTNPTPVELDRLARPDLDEVIQQLGVQGIRARTVVLDQSDGRPGWADLLSRLVVDGDGDGLATGQPLLDQVASLAHSISGSAALSESLACIAALRTASLEDLEVVADFTGVRYSDLIDWLEASAHSGLVERNRDRWAVLRPLQTLIVASTFFGQRRRRRWASLAARFPSDRRLDKTILEVAAAAPSTEVRHLADAWFSQTAAEPVDGDTLALVEVYGQIDEQAADLAAALARRVLDAPREMQTLPRGITLDPIGLAAQRILRGSFRRACSREAIRGLLDLAIVDDRPRAPHPDHPMRVIQEMAQYLDPDAGPLDVLRERILTHALDWFDESPSKVRWRVLAEVAGYVFDPNVEGSWTEPGSHLVLTAARGYMAASGMTALLELWPHVDTRVRGEAGASIAHSAVAQLCELFRVWSSLASRTDDGGALLTTQHNAAAVQGAGLILATLEALSPRFPAVPIAVNRQLELSVTWNGGAQMFPDLPILDDRLARFVGTSDVDDDFQAWMAQRDAERTSLAIELASWGATKGIVEFQRLMEEASVLREDHEAHLLATYLAIQVTDPDEWLRIAMTQRIRSLVGPMVAKARSTGLDVSKEVLEALREPDLRTSVLRVIVEEDGELDSLAHSVINEMAEGDAARIGGFRVRGSVTPMLRELLVHPCVELRTVAAVTFNEGVDHGPQLPDDLRPAWRAALIGAHPSHLSQHDGWRLQQILRHAVASDPDLCAGWFIANAATLRLTARGTHTVETLSDVLRALPQEQKRRVCKTLNNEDLLASGFAAEFLASDEALTGELLRDGTVDVETLISAMTGLRDFTIECLAPALLQAGVSPIRIADKALSSRQFTGSEVAALREDLQFFAALREQRPELGEVSAEASRRLESEIIVATAKEKQERLLGW